MEWQASAEDRQFLDEVREFLDSSLDPKVARKVRLGYPVSKAEQDDWTKILNARGWAAPNWPIEVGGTGWSMVRRHLFDIELRSAHAPDLQGFGFNMVGPAIIKYGTEAQKARYLPKILNANMSWCQGYSETGAGSDLASLRTAAVSDGDDYLVTGSKIWTSAAEVADHIFALVRTNPTAKPQAGISFLLINMDDPGLKVEPLIAFNGRRLWNQVFFDSVRVPKANRLGEENQGWTVAKNLLGNERLLVSRVAENRRLLGKIFELTRAEVARGIVLEASLEKKINLAEIQLDALDATARRLLSKFDRGEAVGAEPSMLKLGGSQLVQSMDRLMYDVIGYYGVPVDSVLRHEEPIGEDYEDMVVSQMFHHRGYTIAGGASEVQRNIIAKAVLEL
ncbi:MAG: alkylation response protein AidB-like acyl-CoA dehydrogenase [Dinoroseobacter sp.]|jgi:alkylation response protein AidB-like acyl-CoA dehydrogenase